jgi:polyisoprenoid-binding protein YceI
MQSRGYRSMTKLAIALVMFVGCSSKDTPPKPAPAQQPQAAAAFNAPPPGIFEVDTVHSTVMFRARHVQASNVYGWFKDFSGKFSIDADPKKSRVELSVKAGSVDTRDSERDADLVGPDFFNAKQFPEMAFTSTAVELTSTGWQVTGDLTLHGVTKPVTFSAVLVGDAMSPHGYRVVGLEARATIDRRQFGISFLPEAVAPEVELIIAFEGKAI